MSAFAPSSRLAALARHSLVRFLAIGVLSYLVDVGTLIGLHGGAGVPLTAATVAAYAVGFLVNFGLNRVFAFAADGPVGPQVAKYLLLVAVNLGLTVAIVDGLSTAWSYYAGSKTIATVLCAALNYVAYRFWVFRARPAAADVPTTAAPVESTPGAPTFDPGRPRGPRSRVRDAVTWVVGDVPVRYWLVLLAIFVGRYAFYHAGHRAYTGDGEYYTVMALRDAGYSMGHALDAAGAYFHDADIHRLLRGFNSPSLSLLIKPRVVYPGLSAPFVWLFGVGGIWVVPVVCALYSVWGMVRLFGRLYGNAIAVGLVGIFMTTVAFWEFGTGAYTEPVCIACVVGILLNLPLGRSVGWRNAVVVAALTVVLTFTRQMTMVIAATLVVPYLWSLAVTRAWRPLRSLSAWRRPRQWRLRSFRTPWLGVTAAALVPGAIAYEIVAWWSPYNPWRQFLIAAGTKSKKEALLHLPEQAWHLLQAENTSYLQHDMPMVLLWLAALVALVARFKTPQAALFWGAAGSGAVFAIVNGTPGGLRYFFPIYPVLLLAVGELLRRLARRSSHVGWAPPGDGPTDVPTATASAGTTAAEPAAQDGRSAASRRDASASTSGDLQNVNRTSEAPASASS